MSVDLSGRVVLVTGGTKGLGRGLAQAFREAGASVMICARHPAEVPIEAFVAADVRDSAQAAGVVEATVSRFGRLDVVINNAGGSPPSSAADVSPRFVDKIVALNLLAPFYVAQAANRIMQSQDDGGTIINIGSVSGHRPSPGSAAYGAAKAGLASLTTSLAMEWAPKVRVNIITVGYLETEQTHVHFGDADSVAAVANTIPMNRFVRPEDVAQACLFLASPDATFITGADIAVHGGGEPASFVSVATRD